MFKFIGFFTLVAIVAANDIFVGSKDKGRKIFDEERIASPAFWVQTANLTYNASDNEVISGVIVTDMRPDKDGSAKIVEGGEGFKNVTIELQSPTMLRGYDFLIEVYAEPDDNEQSSTTKQSDFNVTTEQNAPNVPISLSDDTLEDNLRKTRKTGDAESSTLKSLDVATATPSNPSTQVANDQSTQNPDEKIKNQGVDTSINIGKHVTQAVDVSTTPEISSPTTVGLQNDAKVNSEVAKDDQKNRSDEGELKLVFSDPAVNEQFRNVRDSEVSAVEENDYVTLTTGLAENEGSTESGSTVETDSPISKSSTDVVTVVDTLEALASKKDVTVPRILVSDDFASNDQRFKAPIPYNH